MSETPPFGMTPEEWDEWRTMTPEQHMVAHLGHTMMSLRDLPKWACDEAERSVPIEVVHGCRESFYMHVRTVAEFYVMFPHRDWTARDFMPSWQPPADLADPLREQWWVASKHIAHMSKERVPDPDNFQPQDTTLDALTKVARDCYRIAAAFVKAYGDQPDHTYAEGIGDYLRGTTSTEPWFVDILVLPPMSDSEG